MCFYLALVRDNRNIVSGGYFLKGDSDKFEHTWRREAKMVEEHKTVARETSGMFFLEKRRYQGVHGSHFHRHEILLCHGAEGWTDSSSTPGHFLCVVRTRPLVSLSPLWSHLAHRKCL